MKKFTLWHIYLPVYYSFFMNGMIALSIGTVLPYLIEEMGIGYGLAGSFLSLFALGNLAASGISPYLSARLGQKRSVLFTYCLVPICLFMVTLTPPIAVLWLCFFMLGVVRGSVSIVNNTVINDHCKGRAMALNLLHMMAAAGSFCAPFFCGLLIGKMGEWRDAFWGLCLLSFVCILLYGLLQPNHDFPVTAVKNQGKEYLKSPDFYIIGMVLFFYLGVENCISGWFVTYFKNSGLMSQEFASALVSVTWLAIMGGRLFTALISEKVKKEKLIAVNCVLASVCFLIMIGVCSFPDRVPAGLFILAGAMLGMGFFFSGIYPTGVANVSRYIQGSPGGTALFLAISAVGGILMPQIVGSLADWIGLSGAVFSMTAAVAGMVLFALWNVKRAGVR